ncbi:MAG TPA: LacI family transcriptional regulator [Rhodobacteraceae bacterium]|nr:LacI family transcriptional regulator [Paracoccaceae bacterium]
MNMIHQRKQDPQPTIVDVARRARVSTATVSKVLRGVATVRHENRQAVFEAVRGLGYRADPLAANLRSQRRSLIGLVVPDFENPFFGGLVAAYEMLAEASGYRLVSVSSREDPEREQEQIRMLLDWRVAGLIVVPVNPKFSMEFQESAAATPLVMVDRVPSQNRWDSVSVNNRRATAMVTRHLAALGHKSILVALSSETLPNMRERLEGIRDVAGACDLDIEVLACGMNHHSTSRAVAARFDRGHLPTAIFSLFIQATLATLLETGRRHIVIPDDLSVVGFDDIEWMQATRPPIAAVIQPTEALVRTSWDRLCQRLENPAGDVTGQKVRCEIDYRGSIAPPRRRPIPDPDPGHRIREAE